MGFCLIDETFGHGIYFSSFLLHSSLHIMPENSCFANRHMSVKLLQIDKVKCQNYKLNNKY